LIETGSGPWPVSSAARRRSSTKVGRIVGWMGAADDEPLARESRRLMPVWLTPRRERLIRAAWVVGVALIFVAMGIGALV